MPQNIELQQIPNQSFSIVLNERRYDFRLIQSTEVMVVDISRDGLPVVMGMRCLPDTPLMPYQYLEDNSGNFIFTTENDAFPVYTDIGITCFLLYFSAAEMEAARASAS